MHLFSERAVLHLPDVVASTELWRHDTAQPAHAHEFMEIVVVKSGNALHRTRSGSCAIAGGSVLLIRPGHWHAYDEPHQLQIWNLYVPYKTLAAELAALRSHPVIAAFMSAKVTSGVLPATRAGRLASGRYSGSRRRVPEVDLRALEPYLTELAKPQTSPDRSLTRLGLLVVVLDALAATFMSLEPGQSVRTTHPAVLAATELLDSAPQHPWTLSELAEHVHISASYLCRLFKHELGISPLHYLERHRLEHTAQLLLEGDLSMSQISSSGGWADSNYMTRRFRATYGMSPSRYREIVLRRRVVPVAPGDGAPLRQPPRARATN